MSSAQLIKPDKAQVESEGDSDKWVNSVKESASSIESAQQKNNEKSTGFLKQTGKQMKKFAVKMKSAVAKKNNHAKDNTDGNMQDPIVINRHNDPFFHEFCP